MGGLVAHLMPGSSLRNRAGRADGRQVDLYTHGRPTGFERGADVTYTISELENPVSDAGACEIARMEQRLVRVVLPSTS